MSRLFTSGWESGAGIEAHQSSPPKIVTSPVRSGKYAAQFALWSQPALTLPGGGVTVVGRNYYYRAWINFPAAPSAFQYLIGCGTAGSNGIWVRLNTDRTLSLVRGVTVISPASPVLAVDTWHCIQLRIKVTSSTSDEGELLVNGAAVSSFTGDALVNSAPSFFYGRGATSATLTIIYDDVAVNDDQGTVENSWPDIAGKVVNLKPVADAARVGNWQTGSGSYSNLFDAVDNTPPAGVAPGSANNTSQILDNVNDNATQDETLEKYPAGTIKAVQPYMFHGCGSTGGIQNGIAGVSNPASAEVSGTSSTSVVGTFPSFWATVKGNIAMGDIADKATAPVIRVHKLSVTSAASHVCGMGMIVEYVPSTETVYTDNPDATLPPGSVIGGEMGSENFQPGVAGFDTDASAARCQRCTGPRWNLYRSKSFVGAGAFCMPCWDDIAAIRAG